MKIFQAFNNGIKVHTLETTFFVQATYISDSRHFMPALDGRKTGRAGVVIEAISLFYALFVS